MTGASQPSEPKRGTPPSTTGPYADVVQRGGSAHLLFVHECDWGEGTRLRKTELPLAPDGWSISHGEGGQLSVTPSIHCTACGLHGFFTDGEWRA